MYCSRLTNLVFLCSHVCSTKSYAYIHRSEVALVETRLIALGNEKADTIKSAYAEKEPVNQIEFCKFNGLGEVLVVVNQGGGVFVSDTIEQGTRWSRARRMWPGCSAAPCSFLSVRLPLFVRCVPRCFLLSLSLAPLLQLYDESGQKFLHSFKHSKTNGSSLTLKESHLRGIASDGKEWLYIGTGSGEILALHVTKTKLTLGKLIPPSAAEGHFEAAPGGQGGGVSALAYSHAHGVLASADDWGNVLLWPVTTGDQLGVAKPIRAFAGTGSPVGCMGQGHGVLVAGFASGHIRMFDLAKKGIVVEICAHTRAINAIDVHASKAIVLAAAEDTFVSVWSLPTATQPQVKSLSAESPVLGLITGCRFGGSHGELIVTTTYDSRSLAIMHTP